MATEQKQQQEHKIMVSFRDDRKPEFVQGTHWSVGHGLAIGGPEDLVIWRHTDVVSEFHHDTWAFVKYA